MVEVRSTAVNLIIGGEKFTFVTDKELVIDRDDLDSELAHQAALFAWFATLHDRARATRVELEADLDDLMVDIEDSIRLQHGLERGKKPTETAIKNMVMKDPRVRAKKRAIINAENNERLMGNFVTAMSYRKDMLIALSKNQGLEMRAPSAAEVERIKENLLGRRAGF